MPEQNPYQSPVEVSFVEPVLDPESLPIASQNRRFLNLILDNIFVRVLEFALGFVMGTIGAAWWFKSPLRSFSFAILVVFLYYIAQEFLLGRTLAKFITGTKVVSAEGTSPSLTQIVGRTLCRMIPFEAFTFLASNPVGWHDKFSGTRVVMARSPNP